MGVLPQFDKGGMRDKFGHEPYLSLILSQPLYSGSRRREVRRDVCNAYSSRLLLCCIRSGTAIAVLGSVRYSFSQLQPPRLLSAQIHS
jgi:hypothetical protein